MASDTEEILGDPMLASDVKQLIEDEDTGAKTFRYVRTGTNYFSLSFTYDCVAWSGARVFDASRYGWIA